ncbi:DUF2270 domain-containing protein [Alsobacter soli]|nr:DUF2270 domain-containing protein [Alsobacter soli]
MDDKVAGGPDPPPLPGAAAERVNTLAHFHRAEIARMAGWRDRIDRTTNWAITVVAAMLSVSLSTPSAHHGVLLFAMLLVWLLLWIEARRYRFFDVYRARVRLMERHYFAEVFDRGATLHATWGRSLAEDLRAPRFRIGRRAAMSRRLRRNYIWMFLILLLAWVLKISSSKLQQSDRTDVLQSLDDVVANASLGPLPGWLVMALLAAFYLWLTWLSLSVGPKRGDDGDVHV